VQKGAAATVAAALATAAAVPIAVTAAQRQSRLCNATSTNSTEKIVSVLEEREERV
jgi:hypothetical protein